MFDALSEKLQSTLDDVRQRGTLTESDIDVAMREIRLALLEADVNFKVVRSFTSEVKEKCLGADILGGLNPGQQVVGIVHEQLVELMGGEVVELPFAPSPPTVILMSGLQGSGKTTACAKLAKYLQEEKKSSVALAACDIQRPGAVEQLRTMGQRAGATVYDRGTELPALEVAKWALEQAKMDGKDVLIVDTAGRLHVDQELMDELVAIRDAVQPQTVLLTVDAMTGQDAVNVAQQFADAAGFDGVVMSKMDGDARGGAALSVKAVTGKPIMFVSTGEKIGEFQAFYPDRMAQRILGMGDVLSLIEQAEKQFDEKDAADMERKLRRNELTLEDFLKQMKMIRKMGPLNKVMGMLPGMGAMAAGANIDDRELDRVEAIILSMTPKERRVPELIKGSRRLRIAKGSGTTVQQVNQLVKNFQQMQKVMKQMSKAGPGGIASMLGGAGMPPGAGGMAGLGMGAPGGGAIGSGGHGGQGNRSGGRGGKKAAARKKKKKR